MQQLNPRSRACLRLLICPVLLALALLAACNRQRQGIGTGEYMYVSSPQANLRDHVAAIYNRVGTVKNGERVEVLEKQKRFVRVRTGQKIEGWIELRSLAPAQTYQQFQQLVKDNRSTPAQGRGTTRVELNMHVAPGRETETLYLLPESSKVELLKRATAIRATPDEIAARKAADVARAAGEVAKPAPRRSAKPAKPLVVPPASRPGKPASPLPAAGAQAAEPPPPKPMDDWWLVRDAQGRVGWLLAHMVDVDIPLDIVQYAEGQRIQAAFVLNTVQDADKGAVPQYLVLLSENHDGIPYDFNQARVFTWNLKRHRYETGYREHYIIGYFPVSVGVEDFGREGSEPVFTLRKQNADGTITPRKYRLIGNVVRQVLAPGEKPQQAAHSPDAPKPKASTAKARPHKR